MRALQHGARENAEAAALTGKVSAADRGRLDEYLTSVREVEKRVESARSHKDKADERAKDKGKPAVAMKRPRWVAAERTSWPRRNL